MSARTGHFPSGRTFAVALSALVTTVAASAGGVAVMTVASSEASAQYCGPHGKWSHCPKKPLPPLPPKPDKPGQKRL